MTMISLKHIQIHIYIYTNTLGADNLNLIFCALDRNTRVSIEEKNSMYRSQYALAVHYMKETSWFHHINVTFEC